MSENAQKIENSKVSSGVHLNANNVPSEPTRTQTENLNLISDQNQAFPEVTVRQEPISLQRQKCELAKLSRHIHPELKTVDSVIDGEVMKETASECEVNVGNSKYEGGVQILRWIFENWTLLEKTGDMQEVRKWLEEKALCDMDVRCTSHTADLTEPSGTECFPTAKSSEGSDIKGDTRKTMELFEMQSLDFHKKLPFDGRKLMMAESVSCGDVKETCQLFEVKPLDEPGLCTSVGVEHYHDPEQATQETKVDVKRTVRLLEMEPCCALESGDVNVNEIKPACRGGNPSSTVRKTRWLFETQPLDILNKDLAEAHVIPGISLAETQRGKVERKELQTSNDTFNSRKEHRCFCIEDMDVGSLNRKSINVTLDKQDIAVGDSHSLLWFLETHPTETSADSYEVNHLETVNIPEDKRGTVLEIKHIFETCALDSINKEMAVGVTKIEPCEIEKSAVRSHKRHFEALSLNSVSQFSKEHTEIKDVASGAVRNNMTFFENIPLFAIRDRSGNFHEVTSISKGQAVEINGIVQNYKWMFETIPLDKFKHREQQEEVICITSEDDYSDNVKMADRRFENPPVASDNVNAKPSEANISRSMSETDGVKTCRWKFETHVLENTGSDLGLTMDNVSANEMDMIHNHSTEASESITREIAMQRSILPNNNVKAQVSDIFESKLIVKKDARLSNDSRTHSRDEHFENDLENGQIDMINGKNKGKVNTSIISDVKEEICNTEFTSKTLSLENTHDKHRYPERQSARAPKDATDVMSSIGQPDSHDSATCSEKSEKFHEVIREEIMSRGGSQLISEPKPLENSKSQGEINVENKEVQEECDVTSSVWHETSSGNYITNKQQKMVTNIEKNNLQMKNQPLEVQQISSEGNSGKVNRGVDQRDVRTSLSLLKNKPFDSLKGAAQNQTSVKTVYNEYSLNMDARYCSSLSGTQVSDTADVDMTNRRFQDEKINTDVKELHWILESVAADGISFRNWAESDVMMESLRDTVRHLYHFNAIHSPGIVLEDSDHGGVKIAKYLINNEGPQIQEAGAAEGGIQEIVQRLLRMERLGSRIALLRQDEHGLQVTNLELRFQQIPSIQTWDNELKTIYYYIIEGFLSQAKALAKGILMQEQEQKYVGMTVYLLNICKKKTESEEIIVTKETPLVTNPTEVLHSHRPSIFSPEEKADPECLRNFHPSSEEDCECKGPVEQETEVWEQTVKDPSRSDAKNLRNLPFSVGSSHHSSVENAHFSFDKHGLAQRSDQVISAKRVEVVPSNAEPQSLDPRVEPSVSITKNVTFAGALCDLGDANKSSCSSKETSQHIKPKVNHSKVREKKVMLDNKILINQRARCQNTSTDVVILRKPGSSNVTIEEPSPSEQSEGSSRADVHEEKMKGETDNWGEAQEKELDRQNSELAAAMKSLLLATAEAKSIQRVVQAKLKHVHLRQMKLQNDTAEPESDTEHEIMQLGQKITSKDKEDSLCEATVRQPFEYPTKEQTGPEHQSSHSSKKDQETNEIFHPGQKCELPRVDTAEEHAILAVQNLPSKSDQEVQDSKERAEAEVDLRGDVRKAITSLQSAAGQQQQRAEKEIVRGGLQAALQSLEKSNMNVSRGDYKAAMIYRRGRLSYRECDKQAVTQSVHMGLFPSATTMKEQSTTKLVDALPAADDRPEETTKDLLHISVSKTNPQSPTPLPPKACQKPSTQKPALPPKPEGLSKVPADVAWRRLVKKQ
ncbi:LIM domain-containing protein isoform X1 [Brienomyrus brachyistius]|uniref:LIM domain-containing protein isoform X1 n=1 Tax=Brienomyrus brachyistius TaxID=42636 RepID=UPI0020B2BF00|nr:LIM domain-containing protein isoform X1 [Brienomyrus brachyistius]